MSQIIRYYLFLQLCSFLLIPSQCSNQGEEGEYMHALCVHYTSCSGVTLQSQREDPDAIYGTVDDDVYVTVGDTGQSYYSMVCHCLHA